MEGGRDGRSEKDRERETISLRQNLPGQRRVFLLVYYITLYRTYKK